MKKTKYLRTWLVAALLVTIIGSLTGGTIAWFTDSVESTGNIIESGTLDIKLYAEKTKPAADAVWTEVTNESDPLFNYSLWEPGYTEVRYLKIENAGNLALKYQFGINPSSITTAGQSNLAEVIDMYVFEANATIDRAAIAAAKPVGTLEELKADGAKAFEGYLLPAEGVGSEDFNEEVTAPRGAVEKVIVLKMQETAGNEYQNCSLTNIGIKLEAAQYMWENDSFDHEYDKDAEFGDANLPVADVTAESDVTMNFVEFDLAKWQMGSEKEYKLETLLTYTATDSPEEAAESPYRYWNGDFTVSVDKPVPADVIGLAGKYGDLAFAFDVNSDLVNAIEEGATAIPVDQEFRLLGSFGFFVNYEEICTNVKEFLCGVYFTENATEEQKQAIEGTTITVALKLYETIDPSLNNGKPSPEEVEGSKPITIATYSYTF